MRCGHVGAVSTLPLVPQVVDAVKIPVIAAGGFADGRGFLATLAVGACGIQLGTRLICSVESEAAAGFEQRVIDASETEALVMEVPTGKTVRTLATPSPEIDPPMTTTCLDAIKSTPPDH